MQALYQLDCQGESYLDEVSAFLRDRCDDPAVAVHARKLVIGVWDRKAQFDALLEQKSVSWSLERMPAVDRNIMRVALFEMLACDDVPDKVAINEAIEIAKEFGAKESPAFINGILDVIRREGATTTQASLPEENGDAPQ